MSQIKISVPNDDSCALFHIGKSLIDLSSTLEGSPYWVLITQKEYDELKAPSNVSVENACQINIETPEPEVDTTGQQVESLGEAVLSVNGAEMSVEPAPDVSATTDSTGTPWDERIHSASKALNSDGTWRVRRKPKDMDEVEWADFVEMVKADLQYPVECGGQEPESDENVKVVEEETLAQIQELINKPAAPTDALKQLLSRAEPPVTPAGDDFHGDAGVVTEEEVASIPAPPPPPVSKLGGSGTPVTQATPYKLVGAGDDLSSGAGITPQTLGVTVASGGGAPISYTFPQVMQFLTERHGRITSPQVDQIIADMRLSSIMDIRDNTEHAGPFIARVKALLGE